MSAVDSGIARELRERNRYAPVAVAAGILLVVAAIIQLGGVHARVDEETLGLLTVSKRGSIDIIGAVVNAVALIAVGVTLAYLWVLTQRRQDAIGRYIQVFALVGGVVTGVLGLVYAVVVHQKAHEFATSGSQTYLEANRLTHSFAFTVLPTIELAAALILALSFVLLSLGAMRVGLLTRFMGYLGIFVGILVLFPIGTPVPVVEAFWLVAVGVLFAGRWPSGMPASWTSGKAEPWPSGASVREQRVRDAEAKARGGRGKASAVVAKGGKAGREPAAGSSSAKPPAARPAAATPAHPGAKRTKRKKRR